MSFGVLVRSKIVKRRSTDDESGTDYYVIGVEEGPEGRVTTSRQRERRVFRE